MSDTRPSSSAPWAIASFAAILLAGHLEGEGASPNLVWAIAFFALFAFYRFVMGQLVRKDPDL